MSLEFLETYNQDEITCPHCKWQDSDSWETEEDGDMNCPNCDELFYLEINTTTKYTTRKQ